jgi:hypothetical protein
MPGLAEAVGGRATCGVLGMRGVAEGVCAGNISKPRMAAATVQNPRKAQPKAMEGVREGFMERQMGADA